MQHEDEIAGSIIILTFGILFAAYIQHHSRFRMMRYTYTLLLLLFSFQLSAQYNCPARLNRTVHGNYTIYSTFTDTLKIQDTLIYDGWYNEKPFIVQFTPDFRLRWFHAFAGYFYPALTGSVHMADVVSDSVGCTYVGLYFSGAIVLSDTVFVTTPYATPAFVLAKYDTAGRLLWHRKNEGKIIAQGVRLGIDAHANIYFGAVTPTWVSFGTDTLAPIYISGFVTAFDSSGNNLWLKGMLGYKDVYDFHADKMGNTFMVGTCFGAQTCDTQISYLPDSNSFILKCAPDGTPLWQRFVKGAISEGLAVCTEPDGIPVMYGTFAGSANFTTLPPLLPSGTAQNGYLVAYTPDGHEVRNTGISPGYFSDVYYNRGRLVSDGGGHLFLRYVEALTYYVAYVVKMDTFLNEACRVKTQGEGAVRAHISIDFDSSLYLCWQGAADINDSIHTVHDDNSVFVAQIDDACNIVKLDSFLEIPRKHVGVLQQQQTATGLILYPDPVSNTLYIKTPNAGLERQYSVSVYDISGRLQHFSSITNLAQGVPVQDFPVGMYLLQLTTEKGDIYLGRFIKR